MLIENVEPKCCMKCGKTIRGRIDKKFCDDYCRNVYNNHIKADSNHYVRTITHILRKNRRILESLLPDNRQENKVSREKLILLGFCFDYFTNRQTTQKNEEVFFCYDFGFRQLDDSRYLIVRANNSTRKRREFNSSRKKIHFQGKNGYPGFVG